MRKCPCKILETTYTKCNHKKLEMRCCGKHQRYLQTDPDVWDTAQFFSNKIPGYDGILDSPQMRRFQEEFGVPFDKIDSDYCDTDPDRIGGRCDGDLVSRTGSLQSLNPDADRYGESDVLLFDVNHHFWSYCCVKTDRNAPGGSSRTYWRPGGTACNMELGRRAQEAYILDRIRKKEQGERVRERRIRELYEREQRRVEDERAEYERQRRIEDERAKYERQKYRGGRSGYY